MTRIAFIHNRFPAGGAERITADIARYLLSFSGGYSVFVYASHLGDTHSFSECITFRQIPSQAIQSLRSKSIERLVIKDKIDILVQIGNSICGIAGIKLRTSCKVVLACHGEVFWQRYSIMHNRQKHRLLWKLVYAKRYGDGELAYKKAKERSARDYANCDAYTVLCKSYKSAFEKKLRIDPNSSKVVAIENPEPIVQYPQLKKEKLALFCGRLENWSKRVDRLLEIWSMVEDKLPDWHLEIVGDGKDRTFLEWKSGELGLKRVVFKGHSDDVASYYRRASILCMTSQTEGWPLSLTEGMAQGCICIAFGCSDGVKEILAPSGECGFEISPFDCDEYATRLCYIANLNEEEQLVIRYNGIAKIKQYSPDIISEKWRVLFDNLMRNENL